MVGPALKIYCLALSNEFLTTTFALGNLYAGSSKIKEELSSVFNNPLLNLLIKAAITSDPNMLNI